MCQAMASPSLQERGSHLLYSAINTTKILRVMLVTFLYLFKETCLFSYTYINSTTRKTLRTPVNSKEAEAILLMKNSMNSEGTESETHNFAQKIGLLLIGQLEMAFLQECAILYERSSRNKKTNFSTKSILM